VNRDCGRPRVRALLLLVGEGGGAGFAKSPRAKMRAPICSRRSCNYSLAVPPGLGKTRFLRRSEGGREGGRGRRAGENERSGITMKTRAGGREGGREGGGVSLISLAASRRRPDGEESARAPLAATKGQVSFNYRKSNELRPSRSVYRPRRGPPSCAGTRLLLKSGRMSAKTGRDTAGPARGGGGREGDREISGDQITLVVISVVMLLFNEITGARLPLSDYPSINYEARRPSVGEKIRSELEERGRFRNSPSSSSD